MDRIPTPAQLSAAAANVADRLLRGHLADLRPLPRSIVDEGPQRTVYRYAPADHPARGGLPVLLVPPLAAPAMCFDLRRGCSLVEHMLAAGRPPYLVDYGAIAFGDRDLGLEHWVLDVIPHSVRAVSADSGGAPVQLVGWCLGGIMSLLAVADDRRLPVASVGMVASPFDVTQVPMMAPLRPLVNLTPWPIDALNAVLGGAPAPLVKRAYQLAGFDKYVTKPYAILRNLDDRDFLAQIEAVDRFMANMLAYPGRTFGQLYHRFMRSNDLAAGAIELGGHRIELSKVRQPVMNVGGTGDGIAPLAACHRVGELLPKAAEVRLERAPGGHLGVLTGRSARRTTWRLLDDFLAAHDGRAVRRHLHAVAQV